MIVQPDAVTDPRAMMVHSEHALPADVAVMSSRGLHLVALLAILEAVGPFDSERLSALYLPLIDHNSHQGFHRSSLSSSMSFSIFHLVG